MLTETLETNGAIPRSASPHLQLAELPAGESLDIIAYVEPAGREGLVRSAAEPVTGVARAADGRICLVEVAGGVAVKIGPRTSLAEARDLALKVLDGNAKAIASPDTLFKLALGFVAAGIAAAHRVPAKPVKPEVPA